MREKFSARSIVIPVLAVVGFFVVQLFVATIYMIVLTVFYTFAGAGNNGLDPSQLTRDLEKIFIQHSNNIGAIYSFFIIIIAIVTIKFLLIKNPNAIRREKLSTSEWILSPLAMIGGAGIITLLMTGISALGEKIPTIGKALDDYIKLSESFIGSGNIILVILSTCILVPIAEDLVFRGIIQGEFRRVMPGWAAVLLQGVIFALVHGNPIQISYVIIPAIILGAIYEWTKSIYIPIFLHMIFNFVGAAIPLMLSGNEKAGGYFAVIEIAFIPVGLIALFYLYINRKKDIPLEDLPNPILINQ